MKSKLIVYYSYSGHTKYIAQKIASIIRCDVLELKPLVPYSLNYDEVVAQEHNNKSLKETLQLEKFDIDINKYDEIIIGSPVWWYTIAPVVRTFLKEYDLSQKEVIPFITNAGFKGRSFEEIRELCPNNDIKNTMDIVFTSDYGVNDIITKDVDITNWIKSL